MGNSPDGKSPNDGRHTNSKKPKGEFETTVPDEGVVDDRNTSESQLIGQKRRPPKNQTTSFIQ